MTGRQIKFLLALAIAALLALAVTACGGDDEEAAAPADTAADTAGDSAEPAAEAKKGEGKKVAMLMGCPISDKAWCFSSYSGLEAAKEEYGIEIANSESVAFADQADVMRRYAREGYELIIAHGNEFNDATKQVAAEFPDVFFIQHAGDYEAENLLAQQPAFEQSAYLAGVAAGHMSKSGIIGNVSFAPLPQILYSIEGVKQGARSVNPDAKVESIFINSLSDAAKANEGGASLIAQGADVLFSIPDIAGGVIPRLAEKEGKFAIGFPTDMASVAPKAVIASSVIDWQGLVVEEIGQWLDGTLKGGIVRHKLDSGVVKAALTDIVPEDVKAAVEEAAAKIESGEIEVEARTKPSKD